MVSSTDIIYTYRDALEHARDYIGGAAATVAERDVRNAVIDAYRRVAYHRRWNYYHRTGRVHLLGPISVGTIGYSHSSKIVSVSGTTWSSDYNGGNLLIDNVRHQVKWVTSSTSAVLDDILNPGADLPATTQYELVKDIYTLPDDFHEMSSPMLEGYGWAARPVTVEEIQELRRSSVSKGQPQVYAIGQDPSNVGRKALHLWPAPDSAQTLDFTYYRSPRGLRYTGYGTVESQGTVSIAVASPDSVSGSGTAFESSMVGAVIRISSNSNVPDGLGGLNPFVDQAVISKYESATSLKCLSSWTRDLTNVKYVISDPIDVAPYMWQAFLRCVEEELVRRRRMSGLQEAVVLCRDALFEAEAADSPTYVPQNMYGTSPYLYGPRRLTRADYEE